MNLVRWFGQGFGRKLGYMAAAALVALVASVFSGKAQAQTPDQPTAQAACQAELERQEGMCNAETSPSGNYATDVACPHNSVGQYYTADGYCRLSSGGVRWRFLNYTYSYNTACPEGTEPHTGQCRPVCVSPATRQSDGSCLNPACATAADETGWACGGVHPTSVCNPSNSCAYEGAFDASSPTGCSFEATGQSCTPDETNEPFADADGDGTPDDQDDFPTDPGEDTDTDGDGTGDNGDSAPNDPTDGADSPGSEDGDDEGDNTSSGGGTCANAPQSTGDGILTQIAFQAWKTRCAIEGVLDGDSVKVKVGNFPPGGSTGGGEDTLDGDGNGNGTPDYLEGEGEPGDAPGAGDGLWADDSEFTPDESGWGLTRSCPAPMTITLAGQTRTLGSPGQCDLFQMIGLLVLLLAAATLFYMATQN